MLYYLWVELWWYNKRIGNKKHTKTNEEKSCFVTVLFFKDLKEANFCCLLFSCWLNQQADKKSGLLNQDDRTMNMNIILDYNILYTEG